jgi:hypothetical protein
MCNFSTVLPAIRYRKTERPPINHILCVTPKLIPHINVFVFPSVQIQQNRRTPFAPEQVAKLSLMRRVYEHYRSRHAAQCLADHMI